MTKIKNIVERVHRDAGFLVYVHAGGRGDLNDWIPDGHCYTRAICNIKPQGERAEKCAWEVRDSIFSALGGHPSEELDSEVVAYGLLPAKKEISMQVPYQQTFRRKRTGLPGLFGFTEQYSKEMERTEKKTIHEGAQKLSEIVETDNQNAAYFVRLTISASISDDCQRHCPGYPELDIIGDRDLIFSIVKYLENNPQDYMLLVKLVVPEDKFPKVNKGIVETGRSKRSIIFVETDNIGKSRNRTGYNGELEKFVLDDYGRKVEVES